MGFAELSRDFADRFRSSISLSDFDFADGFRWWEQSDSACQALDRPLIESLITVADGWLYITYWHLFYHKGWVISTTGLNTPEYFQIVHVFLLKLLAIRELPSLWISISHIWVEWECSYVSNIEQWKIVSEYRSVVHFFSVAPPIYGSLPAGIGRRQCPIGEYRQLILLNFSLWPCW